MNKASNVTDYDEFTQATSQRFQLLSQNIEFNKKVRILRHEYGIPENGYPYKHTNNGPLNTILFKDIKDQDWENSMEKLCDRAQLFYGWIPYIKVYVMHGVLVIPPPLEVVKRIDDMGRFEIVIKVIDFSTDRHLKFINRHLRAVLKKANTEAKLTKHRPIKKLDEYLYMLKLENNSYTLKQITDETNKKFDQIYTLKEIKDSLRFIKNKITEQFN